METNDQLIEIDIKNSTCCYFDDIIRIEKFNLDNILTGEKSYKNIVVFNISFNISIDSKPLRIRFQKTHGFIKVYDGTRCLVLFGSEKYDSIYGRNRYLISVKSGITFIISQNYANIKKLSHNSLPLEKTMTFRNVIILIKSVWNKNKNNYHYNIFLEKVFYELPKI